MTFYYNPRPWKILQLLRIRAWSVEDMKRAMRCPKKTVHAELSELVVSGHVVHSAEGFMLTDKGMRLVHGETYQKAGAR